MTSFALRSLLRAPLRTAIRLLVLAAAAALLGAMILFIAHSLRTMSATAVRSVPLDWQGPVGSLAAAQRVAREVARQPAVAEAAPVATAPFAAAEHHSSAGVIRSGAGSLIAVPPHYLEHIQTFRFLRGSLRPGQLVLDQQLAATLRAQVGDRILLTPARGSPPVPLRVGGIALVTAPDVLFQPLNALLGPAPAQPPADIAILPLRTFAARVAPALPALPPTAAAAAAVPGAPAGVQWQIQAQLDPRSLHGSPLHAYALANQARNRAERTLPGQVQFVDNLADALNSAAGDALYAEALYVMLAVPGALIGLALAYLAMLGAVDRDRRDLGLLRARGAGRRWLLRLAMVESALLAIVAGPVGAAGAVLAVRALVGGTLSAWPRALLACTAVAFCGALAARVSAGLGTVFQIGRGGTPLWQKLWLDVAALTASGLVYWLTVRTGFSAVVNPDSNPTLSLSVYMFLAPVLLWVGATLLLVRLRGRVFRLLAPTRATTPRGFVLASLARRGAAVNRGLVVLGLLLAFAVNLAIFTATYDQQAQIDARLTLGADVVASGPRNLEPTVARARGVTGTTSLDHAYAYVGPDLQDLFGIDAKTLTRGTSLRDSYFLGGTAAQMLHRLRARPDAVLVSRETITDYSLREGDLLRLRTLDRRTGRFRVVPFHVAGVVQEFPSAPRDSFMVANLRYVERVTHDGGPNVVFAHTARSPAQAARAVRAAVHGTAAVKDIREQAAQTVSSITTVDLSGIAKIEEAFALLLAAAAVGLFVAVGIAERRHEFATMAAVGKSAREIAAFVWIEAGAVLATALVLAAGLGLVLAEMLVAMLRHVFDPPPDQLALPWGFLAALAGAAVAGGIIAGAVGARSLGRMPLGRILREQ